MTANLSDLICCVALWIVPLATIGLTELVRRKRHLLGLLHPGADGRSDPSAEMWSSAMHTPRVSQSAR